MLPEFEETLELINSAADVAVHDFGASPSGKAQGFGPCTRRFESSRPSHILNKIHN